jgi:hypothetical protein
VYRVTLRYGLSPVEQKQDNTQGNQADQPVVAEGLEYRSHIGNHSAEERNRVAEQNLDCNTKGNQQQRYFSNLSKPLLDFHKKLHLFLLKLKTVIFENILRFFVGLFTAAALIFVDWQQSGVHVPLTSPQGDFTGEPGWKCGFRY